MSSEQAIQRAQTPPPTEAFLTELLHRARLCGWDVDYTELRDFVTYLYHEAGLPVPAAVQDPYDYMDRAEPAVE